MDREIVGRATGRHRPRGEGVCRRMRGRNIHTHTATRALILNNNDSLVFNRLNLGSVHRIRILFVVDNYIGEEQLLHQSTNQLLHYDHWF